MQPEEVEASLGPQRMKGAALDYGNAKQAQEMAAEPHIRPSTPGLIHQRAEEMARYSVDAYGNSAKVTTCRRGLRKRMHNLTYDDG